MQALLIQNGDAAAATPLGKAPLAATAAHDEAWLQGLLVAHPRLLPLDAIDPGAGAMIPVCRELPLPKEGGTVFLDLLGVTAAGRPVLVECKLWRNPQARREVVGQLLEYAALLRAWTYADLTARLKIKLSTAAANPLFDLVRRARPELGLDKARFVDAVAACLARGDFDLIVAGDGIRADLHAIAGFLGAAGGLAARFALVEFQVWHDTNGTSVVLPVVPFRTQVVEQRVLVGADGRPLVVESPAGDEGEEAAAVVNPDRAARQAADRAFWDRLVASVRFTHPDQPPPRYGGWGWVRLDLPSPCRMTLYREKREIGAFVTFLGADGAEALARFEAERAVLEADIGEPLAFTRPPDKPRLSMSARRTIRVQDASTEDAQLAWFRRVADRMVTAVRTRL